MFAHVPEVTGTLNTQAHKYANKTNNHNSIVALALSHKHFLFFSLESSRFGMYILLCVCTAWNGVSIETLFKHR